MVPRPVHAAAAGGAVAVVVGLSVVLFGQSPRANLVLITLDTVRADHLGSYGDKLASTPALDRLASEGVRFADATTHAPLTGPAHAGLLTGIYPSRFGVRDNASTPIPPETDTLAECLRRAGYQTGAFIGSFVLDGAYGFDQGFDVFDSRFDRFDARERLNAERPAAEVARLAVEWINARPSSAPFFAWIHFYDAHAPYAPPPPFDVKFRSRPYDGEIAAVDRAVASVVAALGARGLLDRTLVVAIGDHGESLGEHGEDTHGVFLYDSVLRLPWIIRFPGRSHSGTTVREQVRAIDLMPTVLESLNVAVPGGLDGESLVGVIGGRGRQDPPPAYAETYYPRLHFGWSELRSLRVGDWKAIDAPRQELYALRSDPSERANVAVRQSGLASRLTAEMAHLTASWSNQPERQAPVPDRETLERLRSLGYIGFVTPGGQTGRGADPKDEVAKLARFQRLLSEATSDLRQARRTAAAAKLTEALGISPRSYDVHVLLGDVYLESRKYDGAIGEYEAASLLNPASSDPLIGVSSALLAQGKTEQAVRTIDRAETMDPRSHEIPLARGRISERLGRDAEAFGHYEQAVAANPSDPRPRARLANMAVRLGKVEIAAEQFAALLAVGYEPARSHFGLGWVAQARGDRAAAVREYRRALANDPRLKAARDALTNLQEKH